MRIRTPLTDAQKLPLPTSIPEAEREEWRDFARRLVDAHRHEDGLLNSRLQGFVVATALLMAAVSQFREEKFLPIAALICLSGLTLSDAAFHILSRTARTIEWYIDILVRLDSLLYPDKAHRLYEARRELLDELHTSARSRLSPVSALMGAGLPLLVAIIWFVMLLLLGWNQLKWIVEHIIPGLRGAWSSMEFRVGITDITAMFGAIVGSVALVLSILNYLRDRAKIVVKLSWDMSVTNNPPYDPSKKWALVTISNVGRRPVYLSHASLKLPRGSEFTHLVIKEGIQGQKVGEGDPPVSYIVTQDGLEKYAKNWHKIRAVVSDTAGENYLSSRTDKSKRPSWAR